MDKAYCMNTGCPFDDCDRNLKQIERKEGTYTLVGFDATCERYISRVVREVMNDDSK